MYSVFKDVSAADECRGKLDEMKAVLEWASENVVSCDIKWIAGGWSVWTTPARVFTAPTLYQALHTAWEKRDE